MWLADVCRILKAVTCTLIHKLLNFNRGTPSSGFPSANRKRELNSLSIFVAVRSAEYTDSSYHSQVRHLFVRSARRRQQRRAQLGEARTHRLLRRINFRTHRPPVGFPTPHSHASLEQHFPLDRIPCHMHAVAAFVPRNTKANKKASKLLVGFESHGAKVSSE